MYDKNYVRIFDEGLPELPKAHFVGTQLSHVPYMIGGRRQDRGKKNQNVLCVTKRGQTAFSFGSKSQKKRVI